MTMLDPMKILSDPSASDWLKQSLKTALSRDPVDAANDADVLSKVLDMRLASIQSKQK